MNARDSIKGEFPYLHAFVYFGIDVTETEGANWRIDTSTSSLNGFKALALDQYFWRRG